MSHPSSTSGPDGQQNSGMLAILLTAFIDMMGIGIVIPVMAPLIVDNTTGILDPATSDFQRNLIYGLLVSCYPAAQFFGAPILGALSDRYGRKRILSLSLVGSMAGYATFALGIVLGSLPLLFLGRLVDGFTGGNLSIVYSAIADISTSENKARNFGLVGMMVGVGFIVGPFLGGILAVPDVVSWFNPAVPFWFTAGLCLLNVGLVVLRFQETLTEPSDKPINAFTGFRNLKLAFTLPNLRAIFTVVFLATLGFSFFTQFFNVFMISKFAYGEKELALMFGFIGFCIAFVQGGLIRPVNARFSSSKIPSVTLLGLALVLPLMLLPSWSSWIFVILPFLALFHGLGAPNISSLVSEQAEPGQQGLVMGINQSMISIGNAIPPLAAGLLSGINYNLPTLAASISTLLAWAVFVFVFLPGQRKG